MFCPPPNEPARLQALRDYQLLDTSSDAAMDRVTRLASLICQTPISLVTLLDEDRQWIKSNVGMPVPETPRQGAFCNYVVAEGVPLEVPDATRDERFQHNPLVIDSPAIRFYAGYPLIDPQGHVLGSLCVIDQQPRHLAPHQHQALELLRDTVMELIVDRRIQQRQRQFSRLFVEANDLIAIAGRDGSFKTINPAFERVLGWTADALLGSPLNTWVHPDDQAATRQVLDGGTGESAPLTHRFRHPDGSYRHLHWVLSPEPGTDNRLVIIRDVTAQTQQEEILRQAQQQLVQTNQELERQVAQRKADIRKLATIQQAVFTHAGLAIAITDPRGIIQQVNPALEKLTGYSSAELIGQLTPGQLRDPAQRLKLMDQLQETSRESQLTDAQLVIRHLAQHGVLRTETALRTKEGRSIPVVSNFTGLYDEDQTLLGYVDISVDIASLKRAEGALQLALQRHQLATKAGKLGVWELNLQTGAIQLEADFYARLGLPPTARITHLRDLEALLSPRDQTHFRPRLQALLTQGKNFDTEFRIISPLDGALYYLRIDGQVFTDEQGKPERVIGVMRDRTQARQIQRALQASEARYRSLVDGMQMVVFQTDARGGWTYLNPAWETITGFSVEATLGQRFLDFLLPEGQGRSQRLFEGLTTGQLPSVRHLTRLRHRAGGYRWIEVFAQPTLDARGQLTGVMGTLTDVTDKKEAQDRAHQLHERLQLATRAAGQGIWEVDLTTDGMTGDEQLWALHGMPPPDRPLRLLEFAQTLDAGERVAFLAKAHTRLRGSSEQIADCYRIQRADGVEQWIETKGHILRDAQGRAQRLVGVAWDVTKWKQAEAAVRTSEERFQEIANSVGEIFWVQEALSQQFLYVNPAYETMSGLRCADLYADARDFLRSVVAEDRPRVIDELQNPQPDSPLRFRIHHRDGRVHWLQTRLAEVCDASGRVVRRIGVASDITATMEKKQLLEESLYRERQLTAHQAHFITTASHMFRTPLTAMTTSLELARLYVARMPVSPAVQSIGRHLEAITSQIEALDGLIRDTLSLASMETESVSWAALDLVALSASVIEVHFGAYVQQGRAVAVQVVGQPVAVAGEASLLASVLSRLLQNAFLYSAGDPCLQLRYGASGVIVAVSDEGIGIPLEDQPYIFDRFFRACNAGDVQGLGLGLAICQQQVSLLGGQLTVESRLGVGTTIRFQLGYATN